MLAAAKEKKKRTEEVIAKNIRKTKELMAKANIPNSHTTSLKSPPPYEEVEYNGDACLLRFLRRLGWV